MFPRKHHRTSLTQTDRSETDTQWLMLHCFWCKPLSLLPHTPTAPALTSLKHVPVISKYIGHLWQLTLPLQYRRQPGGFNMIILFVHLLDPFMQFASFAQTCIQTKPGTKYTTEEVNCVPLALNQRPDGPVKQVWLAIYRFRHISQTLWYNIQNQILMHKEQTSCDGNKLCVSLNYFTHVSVHSLSWKASTGCLFMTQTKLKPVIYNDTQRVPDRLCMWCQACIINKHMICKHLCK